MRQKVLVKKALANSSNNLSFSIPSSISHNKKKTEKIEKISNCSKGLKKVIFFII